MNKAERLIRTKKIIVKRWRIMKMWALTALSGPESKEEQMAKYQGLRVPHRYHKFNLNCGCNMCRGTKQDGKYNRVKVKSKTKREIEEQLSEPGFKFK